eukprot:CAMPEP_0180809592 /NCGR_PEP_ID=MMETSP1038_2-20121128/64406_1 /TAXON_ID=632150 /ORGANISM="Azadinium spinosum, Strain 3D9" /LENGTH=33 /DNA_ID= /DNA_START= /DNA_END= /DNA_ORIENTATION=
MIGSRSNMYAPVSSTAPGRMSDVNMALSMPPPD